MRRLKVGVIGVGYLGRFHAEKYARLPEVELVGVADVNPERALAVGRALRVAACTDFRRLLPQVAAVSVAVTTSAHFPVVREALKAGCHVLVEKPLAATAAEAEELLALAEKHQRLLMVGHLERFSSPMVALKNLVTEPRFIESHRLAFFKERGLDVDVVLDLMIHDLDHVLSLVTSQVREIRAVGVSVLTPKTDLANVRVEFDQGCIANLTASRISFKSLRRFRLFQPETYLAVDFEGRELTIARRQEGAAGPVPGVSLEIRRFPEEDVLLKEIQAFVAAVRHGEPPPVSGAEGLRALRLAEEILGCMEKARA